MAEFHEVTTSEGPAIIRISRTREGWFWEWRMKEVWNTDWSEPNGPLDTKAEILEWALDEASSW